MLARYLSIYINIWLHEHAGTGLYVIIFLHINQYMVTRARWHGAISHDISSYISIYGYASTLARGYISYFFIYINIWLREHTGTGLHLMIFLHIYQYMVTRARWHGLYVIIFLHRNQYMVTRARWHGAISHDISSYISIYGYASTLARGYIS